MKIGLVDVDGHNFPNLALMKLSAWHKSQGDHVEWFNGFLEYDKVYMSKIFDFTDDFDVCIRAKEIIKAGVGYGVNNDIKLESHIEHIMPDYSLYGITDTAYGFLTRGCPRKCEFCNVSEHQGSISRKVSDLSEFWSGQKYIVLLDPNLLAAKECEELLQQLIDSKAKVEFNQGLDARLLTNRKIELIKQLKIKHIHFALDQPKDNEMVIQNLKKLKEATGWTRNKISVYVLTNFGTTLEQDLERIYAIKALGFSPYVMVYDKQKAPIVTKKLARYVNNKIIFWSKECKSFDDYLKK